MERKTTHALLLSLAVVAGGVMMTTDAYAQTNTDRLITAVDNTNSILDALAALADAVSSGFASVMASLGMIQADTESIQEELVHVESGLEGLSSDVSGINSDVAEVKDDVASLSEDVSDIDSNIDDISSNVADVKRDVAGLNAAIAGSGGALTELSTDVNSNADAITALTDLVKDIQTELMTVNTVNSTVNKVEETTTKIEAAVTADTDTTQVSQPDVPDRLYDLNVLGDVTVADFAGDRTKHPANSEYSTRNSLVCNGDVYLSEVKLVNIDPVLTAADINPSAPALPPESTVVTENGERIYSAAFAPSAGAPRVTVDSTIPLDSERLAEGSTFDITGKTDQSATVTAAADDNDGVGFDLNADGTETLFLSIQQFVEAETDATEIYVGDVVSANVTKAVLGAAVLYTIDIDVQIPDEETLCYITGVHEEVPNGFDADDTVTDAALPRTGTVSIGLDAPEGSGVLTLDSETVTCGDNAKAEITGASIGFGDLTQFATVVVSAGDNSVELKFHANSTLNEAESDDLPFKFTGSANVTGSATGTLLVQLDYATEKGKACKTS